MAHRHRSLDCVLDLRAEGLRVRRAAKIDANQVEVVKALRAAGVRVLSLAAVGKGCPDLLCEHPQGRFRLIEVKDGKLPPSARRLTLAQEEFHMDWTVSIVQDIPGALALFR